MTPIETRTLIEQSVNGTPVERLRAWSAIRERVAGIVAHSVDANRETREDLTQSCMLWLSERTGKLLEYGRAMKDSSKFDSAFYTTIRRKARKILSVRAQTPVPGISASASDVMGRLPDGGMTPTKAVRHRRGMPLFEASLNTREYRFWDAQRDRMLGDIDTEMLLARTGIPNRAALAARKWRFSEKHRPTAKRAGFSLVF